MNEPSASFDHPRRADLVDAVAELRPDLHRYCTRLMGSTFEGEDVVQDALERALAALGTLEGVPMLRPWLFRIAHNRAMDLLRSRARRAADPMEAVVDVPDTTAPDPLDDLMRQEAVRASASRFLELGVAQRSVVILKDVLGESLAEIADLLDLSIDAVKAHLARGRARLRELNGATEAIAPAPTAPSEAIIRFAALFNARDWDGLRALLADDVRLRQSSHPLRAGRADVGGFFSIYAGQEPVHVAPAWMEGREVVAVFEVEASSRPDYVMWVEWRDGRISFIRDYRYVRYVMEGAAVIAPAQGPAIAIKSV